MSITVIDRLQVRINLCRLLETEYVALLGQKGTEVSTLIQTMVSQKPPIPGMKFISIALPRGMQNSDEFIELLIERLIEVADQVPPEDTLASAIATVTDKFANRSMDFQLRKVLSTLGKETTATYLVIVLQALAEAPEAPLRKLLLMLRDYHNQRYDTGTAGAKLRFLVAGDARLWYLCCHKTADISPFNIAARFFLHKLSLAELQAINIIESAETAKEIYHLTNGVLSLVEHAINRTGDTNDLSSFFSLLQDNWNSLPANSQEVLKRLIENPETFPSCFPDHACPHIPEVASPWMEAFWAGFLRLENSKLGWRSLIHREFAIAQTSTRAESFAQANFIQKDNQENHPDPQQDIFRNLKTDNITRSIPEPTNAAQNLPLKRTILILASSPIDEARLRLDKEVKEIELGLQLAKQREQYVLIHEWAVTPDTLRRALLDFKPEIVHFCGHGKQSGGLVLENDAGKAQLVSAEALARLFELFTNRVKCVLLNACYSKEQAEVICQHIDYVVGMSNAIADTAAIKFAVGFYDALVRERTFEDAYKFGCNAIELYNLPDYLTPVLKKRPASSSKPS